MNRLLTKYRYPAELHFKVLASLYFLVSTAYFFFFSNKGDGDEALFINDLAFVQDHGWTAAIAKNISIPYTLLAYPLSFVMENYMALRTVNLLLTVGLFLYFRKIAKIRSAPFYFYLFFYIATSSFFVAGTNDLLFFTGIGIFVTETWFFIQNKRMNSPILAFCGLVIAFFTREIFMVYVPVVLLSVYFLHQNGFPFFTRKQLIPTALFTLFVVLNLPSLQAKHKISYDDKSPPADMQVTWPQHQYLAQLMVNEGKLQNFKHPDWAVTQAYLQKNGPDSLPMTTFESLTFDYKLTIIEFFKDFYYSMFFGFRQLGFLLFFLIYLILMQWRKGKFISHEMYIPYSVIGMVAIFSFIIISYIELRWLIGVFLPAIVFYDNCQSKNRVNSNLIVANYAILICFSLYGMYKLLPKLISCLS